MPAVGLDLSASLLACAAGRRSQSDRPPLVRGDMSRLPFREDRFFAVLSLFTAFGYFGPLQKNAGVIAEVARVLQTGGCWFLDYFDCRAVRHDLEHAENLERRRELGPVQVREVRRLSDDGRQVCKDVELVPRPGESAAAAEWGVTADGLRYTEQVALFDLAELDDLAARYGLQRIAGVGSYTGAPLGQGDRWLLVYRLDPSNENGRTP